MTTTSRSTGRRTVVGTALLGSALAAGVIAVATPAQAAGTTTITAGTCRAPSTPLSSGDGFTVFGLQSDGNLVARIGGGPAWNSGTAGTNADRMCMQTDGNLVVYKGSSAVWQSKTGGSGSANRLTVQNDGNVVVYTSANKAVWQTNTHADALVVGGTIQVGQQLTSRNSTYRAVMQSDGNFVVRTATAASWSTGTAGRGTSRAVLQSDGNFVVYAGSTATWNARTGGRGTTRVVMQNDGNLVAYNGGTALWSSKTGTINTQPTGTPQAFAQQYMQTRYGWGADQFSCLDKLWTKESGWRVNASNPSSGAYGIPQSLPGSKMASFGDDWQTNPQTQIQWGLDYIDGRYGTPCDAWAHSQATGWY